VTSTADSVGYKDIESNVGPANTPRPRAAFKENLPARTRPPLLEALLFR
jgi:hypothetical protein